MNEYSVMRRWDDEKSMWIYVILYGNENKAKIIKHKEFMDEEEADQWADEFIMQKRHQ